MKTGNLLVDEDFRYEDGTTGKKILVVLNDGICGHYIIVKTTSQPKYKSLNFGCHLKDRFPNFHLPKGSCELFDPTWIMLDSFYEFSLNYFLDKRFSGRMKIIGNLNATIHEQLLNCCIASDDISVGQRKELVVCIERIKEPA